MTVPTEIIKRETGGYPPLKERTAYSDQRGTLTVQRKVDYAAPGQSNRAVVHSVVFTRVDDGGLDVTALGGPTFGERLSAEELALLGLEWKRS